MASHLSIGDILLLSQTAWKIERAFNSRHKGIPDDFARVEREANRLSEALKLIAEALHSNDSILVLADDKVKDLVYTILDSARHTLQDAEAFVERYQITKKRETKGGFIIERTWSEVVVTNYKTFKWTPEGGGIMSLRDLLQTQASSIELTRLALESRTLDILKKVVVPLSEDISSIYRMDRVHGDFGDHVAAVHAKIVALHLELPSRSFTEDPTQANPYAMSNDMYLRGTADMYRAGPFNRLKIPDGDPLRRVADQRVDGKDLGLECQSVVPPTDSGYGSMPAHDLPGKATASFDDLDLGKAAVSMDGVPTDDDLNSIYSTDETSGVPREIKRKLEEEFAVELCDGLDLNAISTSLAGTSLKSASLILRIYAMLAKTRAHTDQERNAAVFIRQSRNRILQELRRSLDSDKGRDDESEGDRDMSITEKMAMWNLDHAEPLPIDEVDGDLEDDGDIEGEGEDVQFDSREVAMFAEERHFLHQGAEYRWLLEQLQAELRFQHPESTMLRARKSIVDNLFLHHNGTNQSTLNVTFEDWDLREFLDFQYQHVAGTPPPLSSVITVSGTGIQAQAMTCGDYIQQIWPRYGPRVLQFLQSAVDDTGVRVVASADDHIRFRTRSYGTTARISGSLTFCLEAAEVLTWVSCVCRSSTTSGNTICRPVVTQKEGRSLRLSYQVTDADATHPESCWHTMFRNIVIAGGYPIPARRHDEKGLETSLPLMAALGQTLFATTFASKFLLKGFNSILAPISHDDGSIQWHFIVNKGGQRLSYQSGLECSQLSTDEHVFSLKTRHFVGWAPEIETMIGSTSANYTSIQWSRTPEVSRSTMLNPSFTFTGGQYVTASLKIIRGYRDRPLYLTNGMPYHDRLNASAKWKVIISDTAVRKHWLCDGTSAILHLCRAWISENLGSTADNISIEAAEKLVEPGAATSILQNERNRKIILREDWDKLNMPANPFGWNVGSLAESVRSPFCLEHLVQRFWSTLEQMAEAALDRKYASETELNIFKRSLVGIDFKDVVEGTSRLEYHQLDLGPGAKEWLQLSRKLTTINLFGRKFGELLLPLSPASRSLLPDGQDYLGAPLSILEATSDRYSQTRNSVQICEGVYWRDAERSLQACQHRPRHDPRRPCPPYIVRLMTDAPPDEKHVIDDDKHPIFLKYPRGALIFGHEDRKLTKAAETATLAPSTSNSEGFDGVAISSGSSQLSRSAMDDSSTDGPSLASSETRPSVHALAMFAPPDSSGVAGPSGVPKAKSIHARLTGSLSRTMKIFQTRKSED